MDTQKQCFIGKEVTGCSKKGFYLIIIIYYRSDANYLSLYVCSLGMQPVSYPRQCFNDSVLPCAMLNLVNIVCAPKQRGGKERLLGMGCYILLIKKAITSDHLA